MKKILLFIIMLALFRQSSEAQIISDTAQKVAVLDEVVFSANKFAEKKRNIAQRIDIISNRFIATVNAQNTGDLLINTGNVFVQKSQQGGSSPVIRGFEASRVLLVVDGIRMNNAIYRAGHLQNVITVDQNMLERVEVMYGPSSTLYGSDALGGLVHMITKPVKLTEAGSTFTPSANAMLRYSSANDEMTGHIDINLGYKKFGFLTSVTYSDFGDLKMGDKYTDKYPDFGRRTNYVTRINNSFADSIVTNSDDRVQRYSGYKQWDFMQKVLFQQNKHLSHTLNLQLSNTTNVPRYDRLQDIRNGALRYAEWYYGPQKRNLFSYNLSSVNMKGFFDEFRTIVSYQDIEESRQTRDYRRYDRFDSRRERIKVWGVVVDTRKFFGKNEITIGADAQLNDLKSVADRTNLLNGAVTKLDSRYPDGTNKMNLYGLFAQHVLKMMEGKLVLNDGIRFQTVSLHSTIIDNSFFNLPVTDVKQDPFAITGNLGLVYLPNNSTKISAGFASGFRAPNIDDLARVFESATGRVVVPNSDIKPEYTYSFDAGITKMVAEKFRIEASGYYTIFRDAITIAPFMLNGQDSIIYNGTKSQVVANQNINKANMYGGNISLNFDISNQLSIFTTLTYTQGEYKLDSTKVTSSIYVKQADGSYVLKTGQRVAEKPMDHIPPVFGKTSIQYKARIISLEAYSLYNGWKHIEDYNGDGEDNGQYATADGMPSWFTLNFRSSLQLNPQFQLQAAVENILDRNYRYFASGFSAPGRNFIVALRANL